MNLLDRALMSLARRRGFVLGPGVVDPSETAFGVDKERFAPASLGDYLATNSAVYTCITLRAQLLSSLPLTVYRTRERSGPGGGRGDRVAVTRGPLVDLLRSVNPWWTFGRLMEVSEQALGTWGEVFYFLERGPSGRGEPTEIYYGKPTQVSVLPDPNTYVRGFLYEPEVGAEPIPFTPDEVIWLRYPNALDEYAPLAPLMAARDPADYRTAGMRSNAQMFKNGMSAGGIVMPRADGSLRELTEDQANELNAHFDRRLRGVDKAHRWAFLRNQYEIWQGTTTPRDMDFLGGLAYTLEEIARIYRVPLDLIGGQRTYENTQAAMTAVWEHAIKPEARFIASELTERLLPMFPGQAGDHLAFDFSNVDALQEGEDAKWGRTERQIAAGAQTPNEWRADQGLEPLPGGDIAGLVDKVNVAATLIGLDFEPAAVLAAVGLPPLPVVEPPPPPPMLAAPAQDPPADVPADAPPEPPPAEAARALAEVRRRLAASAAVVLQGEAGAPFAYARWVREARVALREAGVDEATAQRLAYEEMTRAYEALRAVERGADALVLRRRVAAALGVE